MGISQAMGPDALRAGVVPDTASRPQSPFEGQLIFQRDTNQLLVYDGSAWVMIGDSDAPPGVQLIKSQTVGSGVASVTVTDAFNADFEHYRITWSGGTLSSGNDISCFLGATAPASGYYAGYWYQQLNGPFSSFTVNNVAQWTYVGGGDGNGAMVNMELFQPYAEKRTFMTASFFTNTQYTAYSTGYLNNTTSYTSFTIDPVGSTTMTGGVIRVYGFRNS